MLDGEDEDGISVVIEADAVVADAVVADAVVADAVRDRGACGPCARSLRR
jgi:hypothetical protein